MSARPIVEIGVIVLLLAMPNLAVAQSEVADAAMRGDSDAVSTLLGQGADVNARQADGATAIHWAVYRGNKELADLLIRAGADVTAANRNGSTSLWLAGTNGDAAMIEALLDAGADPNEQLPLGRTPLMLASRTGKVEAVTVLLDHGADVNARETQRGSTPIMWAADQGHAATVELLIGSGADLAARSNPAVRNSRLNIGKANDPRAAVRRQVEAILADQVSPELGVLAGLSGGPLTTNNSVVAVDEAAPENNAQANTQASVGGGFRRRPPPEDGGQLTALVYAARSNALETAQVLLAAGADVNQVTGYGWSPLLVATQNRNYQLGTFLVENGADVNLANNGGWTPLYLATDNRNIEGGDYPVPKGDMDHLDFIKLLLERGAEVNARMIDSSETRTVFTNQWLDEEGATAFFRASQSGDLELMKLLLEYDADPHIFTVLNVTPLAVAAGIGWVEGITYEWSREQTVEAVQLLLDLGIDPNVQAETGRVALHGAGHKGATEVARLLVEYGGRLDIRDYGNTDNRGSPELAAHTWLPVDYADGLVRVGVQSAIPHPETGLLLRQFMTEAGLEPPPIGRTLDSICITEACDLFGVQ